MGKKPLKERKQTKKERWTYCSFAPHCTPHLWGRALSARGLGSCLAHLSRGVVPGAVKKAWVLLTRGRIAPPPPLPPLHCLSPSFQPHSTHPAPVLAAVLAGALDEPNEGENFIFFLLPPCKLSELNRRVQRSDKGQSQVSRSRGSCRGELVARIVTARAASSLPADLPAEHLSSCFALCFPTFHADPRAAA